MKEVEELYSAEFSTLEGFARRLCEGGFGTFAVAYQFEIELLDRLRSLQKATQEHKTHKKQVEARITAEAGAKNGEWKAKIGILQTDLKLISRKLEVLGHAGLWTRQIADAFVWKVAPEESIVPLSRNHPPPSVPSEISSDGVQAVAEYLLEKQWGFPILNDITSCLRIGDITLVTPGQKPGIIEVKTHRRGPQGQCHAVLVEAFFTEDEAGHELFLKMELFATGERPIIKYSRPMGAPERRLARQQARMNQTQALISAEPGELVLVNSGKRCMTRRDVNIRDNHLSMMVELMRKAKEHGRASLEVEDALLYLAVYSERPSLLCDASEKRMLVSEPKEQERAKWLTLPGKTRKGSLIFEGSSDDRDKHIGRHVPPFLNWQIPLEFKLDVLWGKLEYCVFLDVAKVANILGQFGHQVSIPNGKDHLRETLLLCPTGETEPDGRPRMREIPAFRELFDTVAYRFLSIQTLVEMVDRWRDAALEV